MTEKTMGTLEKFDGVDGHEDAFADAHKMPPDRSPAGTYHTQFRAARFKGTLKSHADQI